LCLQRPSKHRPALWWLCAATTALAKSAPSWHLPVAVASSVIAVKAVGMDVLRTGVTAVPVRMTVLVIALSVRTAAPVWATRLSAPNAMRSSTPK
jgi:hypothetical protein